MGLFDSIRRVVGGGESATDDGGSDGDLSGLVDTSTLDEAALRRHAEDVAGEVEQLDFSLDSLEQFDSAIDAGYDEELATADDPGTYATDVVRFGCYLGEVLVRRYDGEWTSDPQWGVTITGADDSATVSVFEVAQRSIETKAVFAAVTERAAEEVGLDGDDVETAEAGKDAAADIDTDAEADTDTEPADATATDPDSTATADDPGAGDTMADAGGVDADTPEDSSPTIDPDDWDDSADESQPLESADDTEPVDTGVSPSLSGGTTETEDADSVPDDGPDEAERSPSLSEMEAETAADESASDDEPAISDVAESEYGFEFERADDEAESAETDDAEASDEPVTDDAADSDAPVDTDEPVTDEPMARDDTADPLTDTAPEDSAATADEPSEGPATDSSVEADDATPEDTAALVEEAEPEAARETSGSESLFDEAESTTPPVGGADSPADSSRTDDVTEADSTEAEDPVADDPTQGDGLRAEYASEAEAFVSFWNEHDLDYTPDSLARLDDLVAAEWDDDRFDDAEFGSEATFDDRAFTSVSRELGSYFGEVLVRELDGEWTDETTNDSVVVTGPDGPLAIPVFRVAGTSLKERPVFERSYDSLLSDIDS